MEDPVAPKLPDPHSRRSQWTEIALLALTIAVVVGLAALPARGQPPEPLACSINLTADALAYPLERVVNIPTFDLSVNLDRSGDEPKLYALMRDELGATPYRPGTYFQATLAWVVPTSALKYPPEAALVSDLSSPTTAFYPPGDYELRRGLRRIDLTQDATREEWAKVIARYVTLRNADVLLDGVIHPDSDGSSAPTSPVTGRKMTWADQCDLIRRVVQRVGSRTVSCNVAQALGHWSTSDLAAYVATGARGVTLEQPWIDNQYTPRTFQSFTASMRQASAFADAGIKVGLIPWVASVPGQTQAQLDAARDAEAVKIAFLALLARRDALSPIYVARPFQRDVEWAGWAGKLGAPVGPARIQPYIAADGTIMQAYRRSFAGGSISFVPALQAGEIRWNAPSSQPSATR